jgi:hypothetical protein
MWAGGAQASQPSKLGWAQNHETHKFVRHRKGPVFGAIFRFFDIPCITRRPKMQVEGEIGSLKLLVMID